MLKTTCVLYFSVLSQKWSCVVNVDSNRCKDYIAGWTLFVCLIPCWYNHLIFMYL